MTAHTQARTDAMHRPVMLDEMLDTLKPRDGGVYLDGTFGGGGYAEAVLAQARCTLWAIDRDPEAIMRGERLALQLAQAEGTRRLQLIEGGFGDMLALLARRSVARLDGVVLDLGVSSFQLDEPSRGFSFRQDGPLDMRMSAAGGAGGGIGAPTASDLVNGLPETELADLIYGLGEERRSRRIARAIVAARAAAPIETTLQLARIIRAAVPRDPEARIDAATRSFQALRLRVNNELDELERGLAGAATLLSRGGRLVVVSFHSLEDRLVKRFMTQAAGRTPAPSRHDPRQIDQIRSVRSDYRLLRNKALRPGSSETSRNPRARSARLRGMERISDPDETAGQSA